jgi:hypothetical protein
VLLVRIVSRFRNLVFDIDNPSVFCHLECFEGCFVMVNKFISICLLLSLSVFFWTLEDVFRDYTNISDLDH